MSPQQGKQTKEMKLHSRLTASEQANAELRAKVEEATKLITLCLETLTDGERSEPCPYLPAINDCRTFLQSVKEKK